jgi:Protein of unknown function (DUF3017)
VSPPADLTGTDEPTPPGDRSRWSGAARQVPAVIVIAGLVASALIVIPDAFSYRAACTGVTATCALAAAMRAFLPSRWVGVLAVRSRPVDAAVLVAMAVLASVLAFSVPLPKG